MRNNIKILVFFKQMSKLKISLVVGVSAQRLKHGMRLRIAF